MADSTRATPAQFPLPDDEDPSRRDVIMIAAGGFAAVGLGLGAVAAARSDEPGRLGAVDGDDRGRSRSGRGGPGDHGDVARQADLHPPPHREGDRRGQGPCRSTICIDPLARNANLPESAPATDDNRAGKDRETLARDDRHLHPSRLHSEGAGGRRSTRASYGGWFCPCHGSQYDTRRPRPHRTGAAEHGDPALRLHLRHQDQDRLARGHGAPIHLRAVDRHREMARCSGCRSRG